jgi:hypothetical protein
MAAQLQRVDNWELRCRFNHARIHERGLAKELHIEYSDPKPVSPELHQPPDTMSQMLYYFSDATKKREVARAHRLVRPANCGGATRPDPKRLDLDSVEYKQEKGPEKNRAPELALSERWRDLYKSLRKLFCRYLGPNRDRALAPLAHWFLLRLSGRSGSWIAKGRDRRSTAQKEKNMPPKQDAELAHFWSMAMAAFVGVGLWDTAKEHKEELWFWLPALAGLGVAFWLTRLWWQGRCGLGQWPNPHGRYYREWLSLSKGHGDYYEWLAGKKQNREPWRTWAHWERTNGE